MANQSPSAVAMRLWEIQIDDIFFKKRRWPQIAAAEQKTTAEYCLQQARTPKRRMLNSIFAGGRRTIDGDTRNWSVPTPPSRSSTRAGHAAPFDLFRDRRRPAYLSTGTASRRASWYLAADSVRNTFNTRGMSSLATSRYVPSPRLESDFEHPTAPQNQVYPPASAPTGGMSRTLIKQLKRLMSTLRRCLWLPVKLLWKFCQALQHWLYSPFQTMDARFGLPVAHLAAASMPAAPTQQIDATPVLVKDLSAAAYPQPPLCPLSGLPLIDAALTRCNHAFDQVAIAMWFEEGEQHCPCCSAPISQLSLRHDEALSAHARQWVCEDARSGVQDVAAPERTSGPAKTAFELWTHQAQRDIYPHPPECPISFEPLTDAVTTPCKHSFDRASILRWLEDPLGVCPCCRSNLTKKQLRVNKELNNYSKLWQRAGSPNIIPLASKNEL